MASSNNSNIISVAYPHTVKKIELVAKYIETWAQKLMNNALCSGIVFIDCMCNCGMYTSSETGNLIEGTPLKVARILLDVAHMYPQKQVELYFNDKDEHKIQFLREHLPNDEANYKVITTAQDAHGLLETIGPQLYHQKNKHFFLFYDPYDATITWDVLFPFFRSWGEVMLNHMVSDTVRAISQVKKESTKEKYEGTYLTEFEKLLPFGTDKKAYEARIEEIITKMKGSRQYFVGAFPFYNRTNSQLYSLVHCTSNIEGFKLYKKVAWQTFDGKSSLAISHRDPLQLTFDLGEDISETSDDKKCFYITDIAKYLHRAFSGRSNVPIDNLWELLEYHPIFPSEGFRNEIKKELKDLYGTKFTKITCPETGRLITVASFSMEN